ncbi:putative drug antiporter protein precursor [Catellatospora methionotrophica]|uniref:Putative drug antiporter protein n=1 Tax=Catellatospora methionotrophica TaxID=121620 RepID=A0A8J3LD42_9ACTN|nr:MFS transporter [Catellatospora methionotrophica]GIG18803.1 putative drug antiporter protein precursor [Catellatospora methionotrophica]
MTAEAVARRRGGLVGVLVAEAISQVGTKMTFVALPWLVLVETGSPTMMGLVAAAEMVPYVAAGVLGAPWIDRLGAWRVTVDADLLSAVALMGIVLGYRDLGFGALLVLVAIAGGLRGLSDRARAVLLRPMIELAGAETARVTGFYDGIGRLTTLIGAPVGGLLIAWTDPLTVMGVDAATFAASGLIVAALVRMPEPAAVAEPAGARESYLESLRGGFTYLKYDRLILGVLVMLFVSNLATQAHQVVFVPLWVSERLGTPAGLGVVFGSFALGAVLGNIAFTAMAKRLPRYWTLTAGYLVGGAPRMLVLAFTDSLPVVVTVLFLSGVGLAAVNPIIGAVLYQRVPVAYQARVFGLAAGSLVGGWLAKDVGLTAGLMACGLILLAATLGPVFGYRTWRQLDDTESVFEVPVLGPSLAVTLAYTGGAWWIKANQGRVRLGAPRQLDAGIALGALEALAPAEAYLVAERIVAGQREEARTEADRLRTLIMDATVRLNQVEEAIAGLQDQ